ncbi:hypothetical protein LR48_Vigan2527s000100 [Vigna angularis]|nr:hypothetical protein LR48_Vigan2527s000100 [Vigna angularis]
MTLRRDTILLQEYAGDTVGFGFSHLSRACKIICVSCSSKSQRKSKLQSNNEIYFADHSPSYAQKGPLSGICGS